MTQESAAENVLTDEVRAWIGRSTEPVSMAEDIAAVDVRRYVEVTGDYDPVWLDDDAARAAGYRARVLPPMMVLTLNWRLRGQGTTTGSFQIPLPPQYSDVRNADSEIEWFSEVYIGERITLQERIVDITARQGRRGVGIYITRVAEYRAQDGRLVAQVRQTSVALPASAPEPT
jgi:acyl dehydratase